jgi:uncharacterized membrane protein YesL
MNIVRTFWKSGRELFEDLFILVIANLLWVAINLPLLLALLITSGGGANGLFIIALLLGVLSFGPANAGIYTIAQRTAEGRTSSWRDFITGLRTHARLSWKVYGVWMLGLVVILFNLQFYNMNGSQISAFISIVFLYFLIVWFGLLIYIGPLMLIQTDTRLRTIARNAALMVFGRPLFTLGTLVLMAIIMVTSIWLPFLLIVATFAFLALWSFRATLTLIAGAAARRVAADEQTSVGDAPKGRSGQVRPRE